MINEKKQKTGKKYTFSKINISFICKMKKNLNHFVKVLISSPCSASVIIQYGIKSWPIWECEPSRFQWNYNDKEICLIIEGQAKISTQNGDIYVIKAGDLVEFPAGLNCEWEVTKSIKKHYRLGS